MILRSSTYAALVSLLAGCATAPSADGPAASADRISTGDDDATAPSADDVDYDGSISRLQAWREGDPIGDYYTDGSRLEGCWANPAGKKLTGVKKNFYCAYPLEFRLCNSIALLTSDDADVAGRLAAYQKCGERVEAFLPGTQRMITEPSVLATYYYVFLQGDDEAELSGGDEATFIEEHQPASSGRSFPELVIAIGGTLRTEADDALGAQFQQLVDDAKEAGRNAGFDIL